MLKHLGGLEILTKIFKKDQIQDIDEIQILNFLDPSLKSEE